MLKNAVFKLVGLVVVTGFGLAMGASIMMTRYNDCRRTDHGIVVCAMSSLR